MAFESVHVGGCLRRSGKKAVFDKNAFDETRKAAQHFLRERLNLLFSRRFRRKSAPQRVFLHFAKRTCLFAAK